MRTKLFSKERNIYTFYKDAKNYISFCPDRGGIITKWISDSQSIFYFDEKRFLDHKQSIRGGVPILFPICGNLEDSTSSFGENYLSLMQHGFARDEKWGYSFNEQKQCLRLSLTDNQKTIKYYPYKFNLNIDVILKVNSLTFEICIVNRSKKDMPVNFGLHPYFQISDFSKIEFFNYPLNCMDQNDNSLNLSSDLLNNVADGIDILMYSSGKSVFKDYGLKRKITLIHPSPFNINVIWSNPPRKMVCMEPWTSPRNSFKDGFRKILISPNSQQKLFSSIKKEIL